MGKRTRFEDLEAMSPAERDEAFEERIVDDPADLPPHQRSVVEAHHERVRRRIEAHVEQTDGFGPPRDRRT